MLVVQFMVGTVDPIQDVESAVDTKQEHIVSGKIFHLAVSLQENQLRNDGQCFQVNGECPKHLKSKKIHEKDSAQQFFVK